MIHQTLRLSAWVAILVCARVVAAEPAAPRSLSADICVVGGGSGGFAAALAASRAGATVILVEQNAQLGGTSTQAYVSSWEPGPGDPIARELHQKLVARNAAGVTSDANGDRKLGMFGFWRIDPNLPYEASLRRAGTPYSKTHGVVFDPQAMSSVMADTLRDAGQCTVLLKTRFVEAKLDGRNIREISAIGVDGAAITIIAKVFVDSTGDVALCRAAKCRTMVGTEAKSQFNEPGARPEASRRLNGVSWCYRIRPSAKPAPAPEPSAPVKSFPRAAHVVELPSGDRIINPLGVLPGETMLDVDPEKARELCRPIVQAHWRWLQGFPQFENYELVDLAPMLGIRESYRIVGRYILTQHDLLAGLAKQNHNDLIAIADHAIDVHGAGRASMTAELPAPYGIPYRCLLPKDLDNVLVACRGLSATHIAGSSSRLSRTMLCIGHAAGLAAAQSVQRSRPLDQVDVPAIQKELDLPPAAISKKEAASQPAPSLRPAPAKSSPITPSP